ncbi:MAG: helix-turn-helix domain-containing protein [Polaromonas sp.]
MNDLDAVLAGHATTSTGNNSFSSSQGTAGLELTAGALLRDAREAAGLHIAALAVLLKVPVKKLEALEQDRFDLLPDTVFARALASSVCRTLKVDATPVLDHLPQIRAPRLDRAGAGISTPFRPSGKGQGLTPWAQVSRSAVLLVLAFLLGGLILIFVPTTKPDVASGRRAAGGATASVERPETPTAAAASLATIAGLTPITGTATTAAVVPVQDSVSAPVLTLENSTLALSGTLLSAPPVGQTVPAGIVVFRATGKSWVEVTDANGAVVLRRTLAAGEVAGASGALPLAAVVGKADATRVQVRGQTFDLGKVARNNVARFEVK